jgi:hypothetical protein
MSASTTKQFYASGTFKNWTLNTTGTKDITTAVSWSSSNTGYFTINQSGLATWVSGTVEGLTGTVSATFFSVTGTTSVYVLASAQQSIFTWNSSSLVHVFVSDSTLSATITGTTFTTMGTPSVNAASGTFPASFQFPSSGDYLKSAATNEVMDTTSGDWTAIFVLKWPSDDGSQWLMNDLTQIAGTGWRIAVYQPNGNVYFTFESGGAYDDYAVASGLSNNQVAVLMFGKTGNSGQAIQINNGTYNTYTSSKIGGGATTKELVIGALTTDGAGQNYNNPIAEIYVTSQTPSSASFAALYNTVKDKLGSLLP